jgi:hypothetical protein
MQKRFLSANFSFRATSAVEIKPFILLTREASERMEIGHLFVVHLHPIKSRYKKLQLDLSLFISICFLLLSVALSKQKQKLWDLVFYFNWNLKKIFLSENLTK